MKLQMVFLKQFDLIGLSICQSLPSFEEPLRPLALRARSGRFGMWAITPAALLECSI